jgi:hypothetical protein
MTKHGGYQTRLYKTWRGMLDRCGRAKHQQYHRYGGRGIRVCEQWRTFSPFRDWALANGYSDQLTIDRINNNGNYEPDNCRWVPKGQRGTSRKKGGAAPHPRLVTAWGETKRLYEWAADDRCLVSYLALKKRLGRGWNPERSMTEPPVSRTKAGQRGAVGRWGPH